MKVHRSRLEVLKLLDAVDLHGLFATAKQYDVDIRTLRRWVEREPSGWQREEEVNRLLLAQKRLDGKFSYRDAIVGLGIATDKLWRLADRAAHAARREQATQVEPTQDAPPASPTAGLVARLDDRRQRLMRELLDAADDAPSDVDDGTPSSHGGDGTWSEDTLATLAEWIEQLVAMTDDEVEAELAKLSAARHEQEAEFRARFEAEMAARRPAPRAVDRFGQALNVTPAPPEAPVAVVAPREHVPMVLDVGYREERGWHSLGEEIPRRRF